MKILIINSAEPKDRDFVDPIKKILSEMKPHIDTGEWRKIFDDSDIEKYDAVIISASPKGNNANFEDRIKSFQWVKTTKKPVLGICAGHHFIGYIFGSQLIGNKEMENGILPVQIKTDDPIFKSHMNEIKVEQHHNDSITLPNEFELLANSDTCKVQAMRHKKKPIYSVQWHAERSNPEIIKNFIAIAMGFQTSPIPGRCTKYKKTIK